MTRFVAYVTFACSALLWGAASLPAQIIITEGFGGSGAALDGKPADLFNPGIELSGGSSTWRAGDAFFDDGAVVAGNPISSSAYLNLGSYINDRRGSASGDFALTMSISETTGSWISLGFVRSNSPRLDDDFVNESGVGTIIYRDPNNELDMFAGPSNSGAIDGPNDLVGARTLTVRLDLTPASGYDGETNFGTVTWSDSELGILGSSTYTSQQIYGTVFISEANDSGGSIGGLSLTQFVPAAVGWGVDGSGSFNVAGNWLDNVVPTSTATFGWALTGTNAPAAVTLDTPVSLNEVVFENINSYSLDGPSTLTLTDSATLNATEGTHFITAQVAGSSGVTKTGNGTVVLTNGANSYTGNTTISGGVLAITDLAATNTASGVIDIGAAGAFAFAGDGLGNGANGTVTEVIQGSGLLITDRSLTSEVITLASAIPSFSGQVQVQGGTLHVTHPAALGDTAGLTSILGGDEQDTGILHLDNVTITGETMWLTARQLSTDPHLISTGTSTWTGPILGQRGGNNYNIESRSGLLTLAGDFDVPDGGTGGDLSVPGLSRGRTINLSGAGDGRLEGLITDVTEAPGDTGNVTVTKTGAGTWTIATTPTATPGEGFHRVRTDIDEGTLAVESAGDANELYSRTIEVASGAVFDISSFSTYNLQAIEGGLGQIVSGAGLVNVGGTGRTFGSFDDSIISPGDTPDQQVGGANENVRNGSLARGTLTINGDYSHTTFTSSPSGSWDFELGDTTAADDNDRLVVTGSTTVTDNSGSNKVNVKIYPVEGTLAGGSYTLVESAGLSFGGAAGNGTYSPRVFDAAGTDITNDMLQTLDVIHSGNNIVLNVSSGDISWQGNVNSAWDIKTTNNWSGDSNQFGQLAKLTFGNVANKTVNVDAQVQPGTTTFDGGAGTTYTVTGAGGIVGIGPVSINSGTVQLQNAGNSYSGATTVASGARLEINTARIGDTVVDGALSIGGEGVLTDINGVIVREAFGGAGGTLAVKSADYFFSGISLAGGSADWVSSGVFRDNGVVNSAAGDSAAHLNLGSYINDTKGTDDGKFDLTISVSETSGTWISVGLSTLNSPSTTQNFTMANASGIGTIIYRDPANELDMFIGPGSGGSVDGPNDLIGTRTITVSLDLTPAGGYNGTTNFGKVTWSDSVLGVLGSGTYTTARNFGSILISEAGPSAGTVSGLSLFQPGASELSLDGQTLTVDGDLTMNSASSLEFDVAEIGQDRVNVVGGAMLDGVIQVTKLGDFTPIDGTAYTLLTAVEGITDLGVSYELPEGFFASIIDTTNLVVVFSAGLPGDYNGDGFVNAADYTVWRDNLGATEDGGVLNGNGTGGIVDVGDFDLWKMNFGASVFSAVGALSSQAAVPEPSAALLLAAGVVCLALQHGRRGSK